MVNFLPLRFAVLWRVAVLFFSFEGSACQQRSWDDTQKYFEQLADFPWGN